jgi:hypothetical protein
MDWKISDNTSVFLYNSYTYDRGLGSYFHSLRLNAGAQPSTATYDTIISPAGASANMTTSVYNNNTKTWGINPGVKHRFGDFELAYDAFISQSKYAPEKDNNYSVSYSLDALGVRVDDVSSTANAVITQTNTTPANDYRTLNNYKSLSLTQDFATGTDTQLGGKIPLSSLVYRSFCRPAAVLPNLSAKLRDTIVFII